MPINYTNLNNIANVSLSTFSQTYQNNPNSNIASAYYSELKAQAVASGLGNVSAYAELANQVVVNTGDWGRFANYFSDNFANHIGVVGNFSVGSSNWLTMQYNLMQRDLDARKTQSQTGELNFQQTSDIHKESLSAVGLPENVYSLSIPLQTINDISGPAAAQAKFEQILAAPKDTIAPLLGFAAYALAIEPAASFSKYHPSWINWQVAGAETLYSHPDLLQNLAPNTAATIQSFISWIDSMTTSPVQFFDRAFDGIPIGAPYTGMLSLPTWVDAFKASMDFAQLVRQGSPLVMDLDGDGVELTALTGIGASPVYWDIDNDGFAEASAWVKADDGLLVRDVNGNGAIDNQSELFGSLTTDGFTALRTLDSNADSQITAADAQFASLRVWRDLNQDGISQSNELSTLAQLAISSINLNANTVNYQLSGNNVTHDSTFVMNGLTRNVVDAWFKYDAVNSSYKASYAVNPETLLLPQMRGYGNIPDLAVAMSQKTTLLAKVQQLAVMDVGANPTAVTGLVKETLHLWAGVETIDPASRGASSGYTTVDGRDISFIEKLMDQPASPNPTDLLSGPRGTVIESMFREMETAATARLLLQSSGAQFFTTAPSYNPVSDSYSGGFSLNMAAVNAALVGKDFSGVVATWSNILSMIVGSVGIVGIDAATKAALNTAINSSDPNHLLNFDSFATQTPNYGLVFVTPDTRAPGLGEVLGVGGFTVINGTAGNDYISPAGDTLEDKLVLGGAGNDTISGSYSNDIIYGMDGDDLIQAVHLGINRIYGGAGNDTIVIGGSDDKMAGGVVDGGTGTNKVIASGNISGLSVSNIQTLEVPVLSNITLTAAQLSGISSLVITNNGVTNLFASGVGSYDISAKSTASAIVHMHGSTGNDTITGNDSDQVLTGGEDPASSTTGNDFISGMGGSDTIYGGDGDDKIGGGAGKDFMYGQNGNDTFQVGGSEVVIGEVIDGGAGANLLETWGGDLSLATITNVQTLGAHLTSISMTAAELNGFTSLYAYDGVPVTIQAVGAGTYTIETKGGSGVFNLTGTSGNDTLTGNGQGQVLTGADGGDVLTGLAGADSMYGGNGNDWFKVGGTEVATGEIIDGGTGVDTLETWGGNLSLATVTSIETLAMHAGAVTLTAAELAGISTITIYSGTGYLQAAAAGDYSIEAKTIPVGTINLSGSSFIDTITGSAANETLAGNGGADTIRGRAGNDAINGGTDHDWLYGESGVDTINGGTGNDRLDGGTENDLLFGDDGTDIMRGGAGNDTLNGGNDDDRMKGEAGNDVLTGGAGVDKFLFAGVWNSDTVTDFVYGTDKLYIEGFVRAADNSLPLSMLQIQMHVDTDGDGALDDLRITVSGNVDKVINLQNFDSLNPTVTTIDAAVLAETLSATYNAVEAALAFT